MDCGCLSACHPCSVCVCFCVWCSQHKKKTPSRQLLCCTFARRCRCFLSISPAIYRAKVSASAQYNGVHTMGRGNMGIAISLEGSGLPVCASARIFLRLEFVRFMLLLGWTDTLQNGAKISHVNCRYWFLWHPALRGDGKCINSMGLVKYSRIKWDGAKRLQMFKRSAAFILHYKILWMAAVLIGAQISLA